MTIHTTKYPTSRRGAVAVLAALLIIPLVAMVAFAVDYGYLLKVRTDLQRAADAAALAATQDLAPNELGGQDLEAVRARAREYTTENLGQSFAVLDSDIEIGRYNPATIYWYVTLLDDGIFDTVRVRLRHDTQVNSPVGLFFARALGIANADVTATATAVLQRATSINPGTKILPFAVPVDEWKSKALGEIWSVYADGKLTDSSGATVPGNWGTVNIGSTNNATVDLRTQIAEGLSQSDLDALYNDGRTPSPVAIQADQAFWANGDPGMSIGMKDAVIDAHGSTRVIPLFDTMAGDPAGSNTEFHIVGWGVVKVIDSQWRGEKKSYVDVKKAFGYDGALGPASRLGQPGNIIDGAYTRPVLVQ